MKRTVFTFCLTLACVPLGMAGSLSLENGWQSSAPREEISPKFRVEAGASRGGGEALVIEAPDLDAAIAWANRCPGASHGTIEVRPVWEMSA